MPEALSGSMGEFTAIRYIDNECATFERTKGGFLSLKIGEESYQRINLYRSFPLSFKDEYISVRDKDMKEIAVIRNLGDFPQEVAELIEEQLERRYFAPAINRIISIKEEYGYSYWDVGTDAGECRFTVSGSHNIVPVGEFRILIIDVDGNRFDIGDYRELDEKSFKKLEIFI